MQPHLFCRYGECWPANELEPNTSGQSPTTYLSCVVWLTLDSHVTAAPGHERAVLADGSYQLSQMWVQLTGSDGPPFGVEEHCAEGTAGEGLFPACDRKHS